jgi:hypothetical protein
MTIHWQVLLTTLGGGTAVLAAAAWLIRTVLNHVLTRDAEAFKAQLKADTDIETERLKSSLQMVAFEHQVRFSNLHAKRADVIAEIYSQMVEVEEICLCGCIRPNAAAGLFRDNEEACRIFLLP